MATPQDRPSQVSAHGPVSITRLDATGTRQMMRMIHEAAVFAGEVLEFPYAHQIAQLAAAIAERVQAGAAVEGLEIEDLCRGRTSAGHIRDGFGEPLRDFIDLAVRVLLLRGGRNALHGHITSLPVKVGREANGLGIDRNPGAGPRAHVLLGNVGGIDRLLPSQAQWFLTGTPDDRTSPRVDPARVVRASKELGVPIPGSAAEHLKRHFAAEDRTKAELLAAAEVRPAAFEASWVDREKLLNHGFPVCTIIDTLSFGAPTRRNQASGGEIYPGDSSQIIEVMETAGRYGIARSELPLPELSYLQLRDEILPALEIVYQERRQPLPPELHDEVVSWNRAHEMQVGENLRLVRYFWFPESGYLLRSIQISGVDGGEYLRANLWRTVGFGRKNLRAAVVLVERAEANLSRSCPNRYQNETQIGKIRAWKAPHRQGLLLTSLLANAAGVIAHRDMELRADGLA
jgi:hypothetical protein